MAEEIQRRYEVDARVADLATVPAADTPSGAGNINLASYDDDTVQSIAQTTGGVTQTSTYALDPVGRRATETTVTGSTTSTVDLHYTGASDNPGWSRLTTGSTVKTTRYVDNLSGDLSATLISDGTSTTADATLELALANPHGDIVTTVPIPTSGPATGIDAWASYDEYGNPAAEATPLEDSGIG